MIYVTSHSRKTHIRLRVRAVKTAVIWQKLYKKDTRNQELITGLYKNVYLNVRFDGIMHSMVIDNQANLKAKTT